LLAYWALKPRELISHVFPLICATSSPGTMRRTSGMFVAPEVRISSRVMTKIADAIRDNFCSFFETEVTSMFIRFSMLTCVRSRPCEVGSDCWACPHDDPPVETSANANRRV
jgi:hypothetical protein